jgi:hypothetical protein
MGDGTRGLFRGRDPAAKQVGESSKKNENDKNKQNWTWPQKRPPPLLIKDETNQSECGVAQGGFPSAPFGNDKADKVERSVGGRVHEKWQG